MAKRGLAGMSKEKRREIARKGGKASGGNFKNDRERAVTEGRKGGIAKREAILEDYKLEYERPSHE